VNISDRGRAQRPMEPEIHDDRATDLCHGFDGDPYDVIVGTVFFTGGVDEEGRSLGISDDAARDVRRFLRYDAHPDRRIATAENGGLRS
ncbi:MAG: hypothetical protein ACREQM_05695, partial [Candidatus Dormibacteraceae bacterium]